MKSNACVQEEAMEGEETSSPTKKPKDGEGDDDDDDDSDDDVQVTIGDIKAYTEWVSHYLM